MDLEIMPGATPLMVTILGNLVGLVHQLAPRAQMVRTAQETGKTKQAVNVWKEHMQICKNGGIPWKNC